MKTVFNEYLKRLENLRVSVIGIGVSNAPLIVLLREAGCRVTAHDKRSQTELGGICSELEALGVTLRLGPDYLDSIEGDVIFRTPGLRPDTPELVAAAGKGAAVTSEMEAFFEVCPCPIIAVTGSDGKTTTTTIISELLKTAGHTVHLGGNIGTPLFSHAGKIQESDYAVLELSSFQLITMRESPHIAVVTNVAPNHLDYHHGMEEYISAKKNIFLHQGKSDALVLNADNPITAAFADEACGSVLLFSRRGAVENGIFFDGDALFRAKGGHVTRILEKSRILLPGFHNIENYMAAFAAVGGIAGDDACRTVAGSFKGVAHRIELVRVLNGVSYYNDSIGTSPTRTIAGLRAFDKKVILIAGGYDKKIPFDSFGEEILRYVKTLVLTGATAPLIRRAVENAGDYEKGKPEILEYAEFNDAVTGAAAAANPEDIVLLSPACASFDRFRDFAERGDTFRKIVMELN